MHYRVWKKQSSARSRGVAMVIALFLVALMFAVAMVLLDNAYFTAINADNVYQKSRVTDYAEAGLNAAIDLVDRVPNVANGTCSYFTSGPYSYHGCIITNNVLGALTATGTDCGTGANVSVPQRMGLLCGQADISGGRTVTVEALVAVPIMNLAVPPGAVNAQRDVNGGGHMPIQADATDLTHPHDATVHANRNIPAFTTSVDGLTYAAGTDSQPGYNGSTNTGAAPVTFPSSAAIASFAASAKSAAQSGTTLTAAQFLANGTNTYTGNVYISGDVDMTQGTATFVGGGIVYVNGYLCLSGHASLVNAAGSTFVVAQQFAAAGNSYSVTPGTSGAMVALGADATPGCSAANGAYAMNVSGNGTDNIGIVWAANGSVQLAGNGQIVGAIIAGVDALFNGGGSGGSFTYDHNLAKTLAGGPGNARIMAYGEF